MSSGWDAWARVYHPLEYLALARSLEKARTLTLAPPSPGVLPSAGARWLLLGDGDGRGLAHLLAHRPQDMFVSLDLSGEMLRRARGRFHLASRNSYPSRRAPARPMDRRPGGDPGGDPTEPRRVEWCQADIRNGWPQALKGRTFDAVVSQFFLDCFTDDEIRAWWPEVAARLRPGGAWWVTDFTPPEALKGWPAVRQRLILASLYPAFRWTTSMGARTLPDLQRPFQEAGWVEAERARLPSGICHVVRWRKPWSRRGLPKPMPERSMTPGGWLTPGEAKPGEGRVREVR
jgi:SAM-dependent methyltransferase